MFPIFNAFQGFPGGGAYLGQVQPWLTYADAMAQAGKETYLGLEPLLQAFDNKAQPAQDAQQPILEQVTQVLQTGQAHFILAAQAVDRAAKVRSQLRPELLPASVRQYYQKIDAKFTLIQVGVRFLQVAPQMLGANQPQSYLVLAQNKDELRATGGFISGIGLLRLSNGQIVTFDLKDSYTIDDFSKGYPKPPEPLKRFMLADYWVTRDSNWSPDFPTAARQAQDLYTLSTGTPTQGVIAFNQLAVRSILEVIGPLQLPSTPTPVTADNVETFMRQAWAPAPDQGLSQEWWLHRKDFMKELGDVILAETFKIRDPNRLQALAGHVLALLDSGQVLVYLNDSPAEQILADSGWDGAVQPGKSDYLYLVDSNVGFNKVDSVIQRSIQYTVDLRDQQHASATLVITYQHTGSGSPACKQEISYGNGTYLDMQQRCYLDYWRVYVPAGAQLTASNALPVPGDQLLNPLGWPGPVERFPGEAGTQVFAGLLMLPPAQSRQISLSFTLAGQVIHPAGPNRLEYRLHIQKQPGLEALPFTLEVLLPPNYTPVNPVAGWALGADGAWVWHGTLQKPIDLTLLMNKTP